MSKSNEALVTPSVMKWAREQAGYDTAEAARRIGRSEEEVTRWEDGSLRPSLAQARKAGEVYRRSLAVFYLPEPPKGYQTLRDFRYLVGQKARQYSPKLLLLIRQLENRQSWLSEWLQEEGMTPLAFIGSAQINQQVQDVAHLIRITLNITPADQMACSSRIEALNLWIEKAEEAGINICRQGGISCEEVRGFVLTDQYAPFIYLNSDDGEAARLFTLVHELAHLWINAPGISNLERIGKQSKREEDNIEIFCNRVASFALLDEALFDELWLRTLSLTSIEERIQRISSRVKVSEDAIARRLLEKGEITHTFYSQLHKKYVERWNAFKAEKRNKEKAQKGGPSPHLLRVLSNGKNYTRTILSSYFNGQLSGVVASFLLHAKVNHFSKVAERVGLPLHPVGIAKGIHL